MLQKFQHTSLLSFLNFYYKKINSSQNKISLCPQILSRNRIRVSPWPQKILRI